MHESVPSSPVTSSVARKRGAVASEAHDDDMSSEVLDRAKWTQLDNIDTLAPTSSMTLRDPYVGRAHQKGSAKEALARGCTSARPQDFVHKT